MKMTKKIMSLAIVFAMVMALAVTSMAASINITTAVNGETYNAYKIFDATRNASGGIAYTISTTSDWYDVVDAYADAHPTELTLTVSAADETVYVVNGTNLNAKTFAAYLMDKLTTTEADKVTTSAQGTAKGANGAATIDVGEKPGYYLVDSTLGALCILNTADTEAKIEEKNSVPTMDKTVADDKAQINDTVKYTITVTDGKSTDSTITVHDKMEAGLTFNASSVQVNGAAIGQVAYAELVNDPTDGCTFEVEIDASQVADNAQVVITYTATVNEKAEIQPFSNDNTAWITYSAQKSNEVTVPVYVYQFDLVKVDGSNNNTELEGAKFELYIKDGAKVALVKVEDGLYRVATVAEAAAKDFESAKIEAGKATVQGLDSDVTYELEEVEAPAGYNILTERVEVKLVANTTEGEVPSNIALDVQNFTGTELPSTGGIGTTIFYALGGLMAVGAGVLLVAKKRMEA